MDFTIPEVGENIESGTVVDIYVSVGDAVKKDQDLFEFETDKASLPVPSPCDGVIQEILIAEGDDVTVGSVAMKIDESGAPVETTTEQKETPAQTPKEQPAPQQAPAQTAPQPAPQPAVQQTATAQHAPLPNEAIPAQVDVPAAPSVRRFAREIGVEVSQVKGSGPGGRISEEDVKAYAKMLLTGGMQVVQAGPEVKPLPDFTKYGEVKHIKMSKIRKVTAEHLSYCWQTIPHVTQFGKADITDLEQLRKKESTEERKLTITPYLLQIMADALKEFPQFNASVDMENTTIIHKEYFHIGVAVDTDRGLLVPKIRDVDQKDIFALTDELNEMAERARTKKTGLDELQGGSITLTNLGGIFGTSFTPIVNWPEVAILGVSRGGFEPTWNKEEKKFEPRLMLPLSLSYDHRIIDGADGARFLKYVCNALENKYKK